MYKLRCEELEAVAQANSAPATTEAEPIPEPLTETTSIDSNVPARNFSTLMKNMGRLQPEVNSTSNISLLLPIPEPVGTSSLDTQSTEYISVAVTSSESQIKSPEPEPEPELEPEPQVTDPKLKRASPLRSFKLPDHIKRHSQVSSTPESVQSISPTSSESIPDSPISSVQTEPFPEFKEPYPESPYPESPDPIISYYIRLTSTVISTNVSQSPQPAVVQTYQTYNPPQEEETPKNYDFSREEVEGEYVPPQPPKRPTAPLFCVQLYDPPFPSPPLPHSPLLESGHEMEMEIDVEDEDEDLEEFRFRQQREVMKFGWGCGVRTREWWE